MNLLRSLVGFILFIGFGTVLSAQDIYTRYIKTDALTIHDGLSQGMVNCIYQDHLGFMWFGTLDGLNRYDGYRFTVYQKDPDDTASISGNWITSIFEDSQNRLWIGTALNGLNLFDRETEKFIHFRHSFTNNNSISENKILSIQEDKTGAIWVGTTNGLNKLRITNAPLTSGNKLNVTITKVKLDDTHPERELFYFREQAYRELYFEPSFFIDKNGIVWVSVIDGLYRVIPSLNSKDSITKVELAKYSAESDPLTKNKNDVYNFVEDTLSNILYLMRIYFITAINNTTGVVSYFKPGTINPGVSRTQMIINAGSIWETANNSVLQIDVINKKITTLKPKNSDHYNFINYANTVYKDRSGIIWIGTKGYGILKYNPLTEKFNAVSTPSVLCMSATPDSGVIMQSKKLFKFFPDPVTKEYKVDTSFFIKSAEAIPEGVPDIAVQTKAGKYYIKIGRITEYDPAAGSVKIINNSSVAFPFYMDADDNLWFGSSKAFCRVDKSTSLISEYPYPLEKISMFPYQFLESVYQDADKIFWLGTVNGLFRFDEKNKSWKQYINIPNDTTSLSTDVIFSICPDPNLSEKYLWIGTNGGGLNCFNKQSGKFVRYTEKDGLPNKVVYGILNDDAGNLWMSTNKGISRFTPPRSAVEKGIFASFEEEDGLQSNEFNRYAYAKAKDGKLFFGGINGFNYFNPKDFNDNSYIPNIIITDFKIGNKSVSFSEKNKKGNSLAKPIFLTDKITLAYSDNMISFEFSAMDFTAPEKNVFQYKMEGFDKEWIQSGTNHIAIYTNLYPGTYTFKVKGSAGNAASMEKEASVLLYISPPYYMTWWFRLLVLSGIAAIVYAAFRYRFEQAVKLMQVRNRIASDLHDEIGSTLSSVHIYSEVAQNTIQDKVPEASAYLKLISVDVSNMIEALSDIVWTVNAKNDRFENIINRMRATAIELFEARNFQLHLQLDEKLNQLKMGMASRKNFYLFYKEAINNVAKYSEAKNVWIQLDNKNRNIVLIVKDDGKGFDINIKNEGNGLSNMNKRATDLKGKFEIQSAFGKGTEVKLLFPNS